MMMTQSTANDGAMSGTEDRDDVMSDSTMSNADVIDNLDVLLMWDATSVVSDTRAVTPPAEAAAYGVDRVDAKSPEKKQPRDSGSSGDEGWDEGGEGVDAKRQKRMRRNRESAAMSRERKKTHIDELEHKLAMLSSTVATLQAENDALRSRLTEVGVP